MFAVLLLAVVLQKPPKPPSPPADATAAKLGTISGKVTAADTGAPLKRAQVTIRSVANYGNTFSATTDDAGLYELKNLDPGRYSALAAKPGYVSGPRIQRSSDNLDNLVTVDEDQQVKDINFNLQRGGVISGKLADSDGEPVAGVSVQVLRRYYNNQGRPEAVSIQMVRSNDRGEYRVYDLPPGRYYVASGQPPQTAGQAAPPPTPYGRAYYPSVASFAEAQAVVLAPGGETNGINFMVPDGAFYAVSGTVVDPRGGNPSTFWVNGFSGGGTTGNFYTQAKADGSFRLSNVPPGHYEINAGGPGRGAVVRNVEVINGDVVGVTLNLGSGTTIKGQLRAEGGALPQGLRIFGNRLNANGSSVATIVADPAADGTFTIENVQAGNYVMQIMPNAPGNSSPPFFVSATTLQSVPQPESEFSVTEGSGPLELSVVLDFAGGAVSGNVVDQDGKPIQRTPVVALSGDLEMRKHRRFFIVAFTNSKGAFKAASIVPGDYLLLVWPGNPNQLMDPDIFSQVAKYAESITIEKSGSVSKDLKLSPELRALAQQLSQ